MLEDIAKINYTNAGVSIIAQNEVNSAIKEKLSGLNLNAEGLFGGAVDISHLKKYDSIPIGVVGSSIVEDESASKAGKNTVVAAFKKIKSGINPVAILDYFASPGMDVDEVPSFVEGVAVAGLEKNVPTIGGESAQMPGTYKEGKRDAYVHIIYNGKQGTTVDISDMVKNMEKPLLCASTDGTGTKTRIVKDPRDIIYHGGNDLGAIGVKPVAFALYVAGNASQETLEDVVRKSGKICDTLGITALDPILELKPEEYNEGEVDIAGTVIGVIDEKDMIAGESVKKGDAIIGFATDCLMTNGYSLARKYVEMIGRPKAGGLTKEATTKELSKTHVPYTDILFGNDYTEGLLSKFGNDIKATAHITGGGQRDNIGRMVPGGLCAVVQKEVLPLPPIIRHFKMHGADIGAMDEAFNMGVGFTVTVSEEVADDVIDYVNKKFRHSIKGIDRQAAQIGGIRAGEKEFEYVNYFCL